MNTEHSFLDSLGYNAKVKLKKAIMLIFTINHIFNNNTFIFSTNSWFFGNELINRTSLRLNLQFNFFSFSHTFHVQKHIF